jgi:hypothetical protein
LIELENIEILVQIIDFALPLADNSNIYTQLHKTFGVGTAEVKLLYVSQCMAMAVCVAGVRL